MPANRGILWDLIDESLYEETKRMKCVYCDEQNNDNITRFKQHAIKCKKVPMSEKIRCIKNFSPPAAIPQLENQSVSAPDNFSVASCSSLISPDSSVSQNLLYSPVFVSNSRKRTFDGKITSFMDQINKQTQDEASKNLAKFFFKNFNIIKDEHLMQFCKVLRPSFVLPSLHQLKSTFLDQEYDEVKKLMDHAIDEANGVTIVIDGWSNVRRDDIVNIILCTPKPYFYSSINTQDNQKTAVYLKSLVDPILAKYGPGKLNAIVSDNAANMKKLGKDVNLENKNIFFSGCCSHLLSLLIKDFVFGIPEFKGLFEASNQIVKAVTETPTNLHAYKRIIKERGGTTLKSYSKTRFYGVTIMYKSLLDNTAQLKSLAMKEGVAVDFSVQETIVDFRKQFWPSLKLSYILLNKIANLIGLFESYESTLGDVVHNLNNLSSFLDRELDSFAISTESKVLFVALFDKRFKAMTNDYTCLACLLHPKYWQNSVNNLTVGQTTTANDFFPI